MSTWIKIANSMPANPKVLEAGSEAMWLHICALCYANEHLTDGLLERRVLPVVAIGIPRPLRFVERLVRAGLWDEIETGWTIHNYTQYQRPASEIRKQREAAVRRQQKWRESRVGNAEDAT